MELRNRKTPKIATESQPIEEIPSTKENLEIKQHAEVQENREIKDNPNKLTHEESEIKKSSRPKRKNNGPEGNPKRASKQMSISVNEFQQSILDSEMTDKAKNKVHVNVSIPQQSVHAENVAVEINQPSVETTRADSVLVTDENVVVQDKDIVQGKQFFPEVEFTEQHQNKVLIHEINVSIPAENIVVEITHETAQEDSEHVVDKSVTVQDTHIVQGKKSVPDMEMTEQPQKKEHRSVSAEHDAAPIAVEKTKNNQTQTAIDVSEDRAADQITQADSEQVVGAVVEECIAVKDVEIVKRKEIRSKRKNDASERDGENKKTKSTKEMSNNLQDSIEDDTQQTIPTASQISGRTRRRKSLKDVSESTQVSTEEDTQETLPTVRQIAGETRRRTSSKGSSKCTDTSRNKNIEQTVTAENTTGKDASLTNEQHTGGEDIVGDDDKGSYQSNLVAMIRIVTEINLTDKHLKNLRKWCPFWNLINAIVEKRLKLCMYRKNDSDIKAIISNFDRESDSFNFDGVNKKLNKNDIQRIFGISDGTERIKLRAQKRPQHSDFYKRRFVRSDHNLCKKQIADEIVNIAGSTKKRDVKDVTRLLTLYCLQTLLVSKKGAMLPWSYVRLVLDLEKLKSYDWSGHAYEVLMTSLKKETNVSKVVGCVIALPIWFMECFEPYKPSNPTEEMFCIKWTFPQLAKLTKTDTINNLSQMVTQRVAGNENNVQGGSTSFVPLQPKTVGRSEPMDSQGDEDDEFVPETAMDEQGKCMRNVFDSPTQHLDNIVFESPMFQSKAQAAEKTMGVMRKITKSQKTIDVVGTTDHDGFHEGQNVSSDERITILKEQVAVQEYQRQMKEIELNDVRKREEKLIKEVESLNQKVADHERLVKERGMSTDERITKLEEELAAKECDLVVKNIELDEIKKRENQLIKEVRDLKQKVVEEASRNDDQMKMKNIELDCVKRRESRLIKEAGDLKQKLAGMTVEKLKIREENECSKKSHVELQQKNKQNAYSSAEMPELPSTQVVNELTIECQKRTNVHNRVDNLIEKAVSTFTQACRKTSLLNDIRAVAAVKQEEAEIMLRNDREARIAKGLNIEEATQKELVKIEALDIDPTKGSTSGLTYSRKSKRLAEIAKKKVETVENEKSKGPVPGKPPRPPRKLAPLKLLNEGLKRKCLVSSDHVGDAAHQVPEKTNYYPSYNILTPSQLEAIPEEDEVQPLTAEQIQHLEMVDNKLPEDISNKLKVIKEKKGNGCTIWRISNKIEPLVTLQHIYEIRIGDELSSNIIDGYAEMLKKRNEDNVSNKFLILEGATWKFITGGSDYVQTAKNRIDRLLSQNYGNDLHKIIIPILSNGGKNQVVQPNHWSLLVFETISAKWYFYNSFKEVQKENGIDKDIYEKDAQTVKNYVEAIIKKIVQKRKLKDFISQFIVKTENEVSQQSATSLECGVYVCYWMNCLADEQEIPTSISENELTFFKAALITNFLAGFDLQKDLIDNVDDGFQDYCAGAFESDFKDDDL